jgi:hypothetical protein
MQDHQVHGLVGSRPDQTYCGKVPFGLTTTTDKERITCLKCLSVVEKVRVGGNNAKNKYSRYSTPKAKH